MPCIEKGGVVIILWRSGGGSELNLLSLEGGALRNISLCEARYVAPHIPDNYCIVSLVQLYEPMKLVNEFTA